MEFSNLVARDIMLLSVQFSRMRICVRIQSRRRAARNGDGYDVHAL